MADATEELTPESILPSQFAEARVDTPERGLLLALLLDAVVLAVNQRHSVRGREALEWIASDEPSDTFGFREVCEYLDLEPASLRAALRKLSRVARFHHFGGTRHHVSGRPFGDRRAA